MATTPPPKIEATISGNEVARVKDVQALPFSWTTIERPFSHADVTIRDCRVITSLSYGPAQERVRMVAGEKVKTMEEAKVFDKQHT